MATRKTERRKPEITKGGKRRGGKHAECKKKMEEKRKQLNK